MKTKKTTPGWQPRLWLLALTLLFQVCVFAGTRSPAAQNHLHVLQPELRASATLAAFPLPQAIRSLHEMKAPPACITAVTQVTPSTSCTDSCGNTVTVTPSGGTAPYTYIWLLNNVQLAGSGNTKSSLCPGTYTVIVKDANGCAVVKTVVVPPSLMSPDGIKIENQTCWVLRKNNQVWVNFDIKIVGGVGPYTTELVGVLPPGPHMSYNARPNTWVTIRVVDSRGCVGMIRFRTKDCSIIPGTGDLGDPPKGLVYPNPNSGMFTLDVILTEPSPIDISIYDLVGNKVYYSDQGFFRDPGTYSFPIDVSTVPNGTYHLLINDGEDSVTFIKQ